MSTVANDKQPRSLTFRALVIAVVGLFAAGIWIQFHEVLVAGSTLVENSPPAGAVGIFIVILLFSLLVKFFNQKWRLRKGELVVIYTALVVAAPLMTQGMWHRFLGLMISVPRTHPVLLDSYSEKLWPHGQNLISNSRFTSPLGEAESMTADPADRVRVVEAPETRVGPVRALELSNPLEAAEDADEAVTTTFRIRLPRRRDDELLLVRGENYYFTMLVKRTDFSSRTRLEVELRPDVGEPVNVLRLLGETDQDAPYSYTGGYERVVQKYVEIPQRTEEHLELVLRLSGPGTAALTDVRFFSNESMFRLHKGTTEIAQSDWEELQARRAAEGKEPLRNQLLVVPDGPVERVVYRLKAYIPWSQWSQPIFYWSTIVVAMFLALLGVGVIMRKQWSEKERFPFPLVVLPRLMVQEEERDGKVVLPLWSKPIFRVGMILAFLYVLLQGIAYYVPGMPDPTVEVSINEYFSSPAVKAFIKGFYTGDNFKIMLLVVAIAFFIDLDMLASIILLYWVCKIPFYFGQQYGLKVTIPHVQDPFPFAQEQHIGAFLMLAVLVVWTARKHLWGVVLRVLGRPDGEDDSKEAMSYRTAAALVVLSFAYFAVWGTWTGLGAAPAIIFFGFLVVCGFSAARIRTEVGAPWTYFTPYFPFLIFYLMGGVKIFGVETMLLTYAAGGFMAVAQFLMFAPTQVEMLHLADQEEEVNPRGVSWGMLVGLLGGIFIGGYVVMVWCFGKGGDTIQYMKAWAMGQDWYFRTLIQSMADLDAAQAQAEATGAEDKASKILGPWIGVGTGAGLTWLLTFLRGRFVGFWVHPLAYVLANTFFIYMVWGSIHVAWLVKWLGLKIGGPRLIRDQMTPLFAGVFVGAVAGMAFWDIIAAVSMAQGARDVFVVFP
jgi:hypothetical protein